MDVNETLSCWFCFKSASVLLLDGSLTQFFNTSTVDESSGDFLEKAFAREKLTSEPHWVKSWVLAVIKVTQSFSHAHIVSHSRLLRSRISCGDFPSFSLAFLSRARTLQKMELFNAWSKATKAMIKTKNLQSTSIFNAHSRAARHTHIFHSIFMVSNKTFVCYTKTVSNRSSLARS